MYMCVQARLGTSKPLRRAVDDTTFADFMRDDGRGPDQIDISLYRAEIVYTTAGASAESPPFAPWYQSLCYASTHQDASSFATFELD